MSKSFSNTVWLRFAPFLRWWPSVNARSLRSDLVAGLVGALIVLPQGVAFATLAGMPPAYGLYAAMVPAVVAAFWGSSWHLVSGPTNAISLVVFATMSHLAEPGSEHYISLVLTLAFMVGVMQLVMGMVNLGTLVNFISHTVVIGFTAGAAVLIIASQIRNFFGLPIPRGVSFIETLHQFILLAGQVQPWVVVVGLVTLASGMIVRHWWPRFPYMIVALLAGSICAYVLNRWLGQENTGIRTIGALPAALPSLSIPEFKLDTLRHLVGTAVAVTVLGLTEAVSIARSIATKSGQRIDGNQEFIGQGLSNIIGSFFSAYPSSGSFNRSGVNYEAGAVTPLAAVFSAPALILIVLAVAPLVAYLPTAAMAGILFLVAWGLIDFHHIAAIARASRAEAAVLGVTFVATLVMHLEFAILVGIVLSLLFYLNRTSRPKIHSLLPDLNDYFLRMTERLPGQAECPQVKAIRIDGSFYFGAVNHIDEYFHEIAERHPGQKHLLLDGKGINFIDVAGADLLAHEAERRRKAGGGMYFFGLRETPLKMLGKAAFSERLGAMVNFPSTSMATSALVPTLDPAICATCKARVFSECSAMPGAENKGAT
ncbi:MAG: SulP family inorganic anion transporter [Betaproteobacteria bacterium]|nr:SulP family inorganic anion transporter [Betaproteobacteria bacterium]